MRPRGFTLIELLVVIAVMGAVMALVGPLGTEQVARSERISELKRVEALLEKQAQNAFLQTTPVEIIFNGKSVRILMRATGDIRELDFEHTFFPPQQLFINHHGVYSQTELLLQTGNRQVQIKLPDIADGSNAQ